MTFNAADLSANLDNPVWRINHLYKIIIKGNDDEDDEGLVIQFKMNRAQRRLVARLHNRNLILKARQMGFSTLVCIVWLDTALFSKSPIRCGVIAQDREAAEILFRGKILYAYDNLPEPLRAAMPVTKRTASEIEFGHNGSSIRVATSMRSGTIHRLHVCLSGDTDILLKDGVTKPIRDIEVGDLVMTGKASYLPAQALVKNRIEDVGEPMLSLDIHGWHKNLKLTANHQILTREFKTGAPVWKDAGSVEPGDYIAFPVREISNKLRSRCLPFGPQTVCFENGKRTKDAGQRIPVTFDLGLLIGMYLAEGHVRRTETTFALHRGDEVSWFCDLLEKFSEYFTSYRIYDFKTSLTTSVVVNGKLFAEFVSSFFGCGSDKKIPDSVWGYGRKFVDGLIFGYFQGDGCFSNPREVQITSIRQQLINQIRMLLLSTRFGASSIYHRPAGRYYGRNCKETWVLKMHGAANWKFREYFGLELPEIGSRIGQIALSMPGKRNPIGRKNWRRGKDYYWMRIKSVDIAEDEPFVYDIVLPKDPHNYVTVNGVVHNSEFGKICAKYPDKAKEVVTGSIPAVPTSGILIIESTAEGQEGAFYEMSERARALQESGAKLSTKDYRFHFFPWWEAPEYVLPACSVSISPVLLRYFTTIEGKIGRKLSDEQRAWYAATVDSDFSGDQSLMWQEYPSFPEEAFQVSTEGCYYAEQLSAARKAGRIIKGLPILPVPVNTFWDLGRGDMSTIWCHQFATMQDRFLYYYENSGEDLIHYVTELQRWAAENRVTFGVHYLPHEADYKRLGKDPDTNQTLKEMFEELWPNQRFEIVPRISNLQAGITATRQAFPSAHFDEEGCAVGLKRVGNYRKKWNKTTGCWSDQEQSDDNAHGADALRQWGQEKASGNVFSSMRAPASGFKRRGSPMAV